MKFSSRIVFFLAMLTTYSLSTHAQLIAPPGTEQLGPDGIGFCTNQENGRHDYAFTAGQHYTVRECDQLCRSNNPLQGLRGFSTYNGGEHCYCWYDDGRAPGTGLPPNQCPPDSPFVSCRRWPDGSGPVNGLIGIPGFNCFRYLDFPVAQANGDPHFRTWKNEHFEFHGQCDLVMTSVQDFGGPDMHLDIHLRTKMVRFWSFIQAASIRIGNDILEVQGGSAANYWINYEYRGNLSVEENKLGDVFPVTLNRQQNKYVIDLDPIYPGQSIEIKTFQEFVGVKIIRASKESFGNAVGITGNFITGKTLARDGVTVLQDYTELGLEWQVLPSDGKLFREMARPQFPELCYLPEDPRGDRARRLGESSITEEAAETACAALKDDFDRKGCIYDILATQDLDMVGAY